MGASMGQEQAAAAPRLEDIYHLQKVKLGQGSFGTVWRGVDKRTDGIVAIKQVLRAQMPKRGIRQADIEREIAMMRACVHENLLRLFDVFFEEPDSIYLAIEYCDGGDFGDKIKERGSDLQETEAAEWTRQVCSAVVALHSRSICHRDIKPDNFLVSCGKTLKLSDFGLAVFAPRDRLLTEKCGTPAFMSPEVHLMPEKSRGYWLPVDMWAVGCVLYMLIMGGRHPFLSSKGEMDKQGLLQGCVDFSGRTGFFTSAPTTLPQFREEARTLCRRMLEPNPRQRIQPSDALRCPWLPQVGMAMADILHKPASGPQLPSPPPPQNDGLPPPPPPMPRNVPTTPRNAQVEAGIDREVFELREGMSQLRLQLHAQSQELAKRDADVARLRSHANEFAARDARWAKERDEHLAKSEKELQLLQEASTEAKLEAERARREGSSADLKVRELTDKVAQLTERVQRQGRDLAQRDAEIAAHLRSAAATAAAGADAAAAAAVAAASPKGELAMESTGFGTPTKASTGFSDEPESRSLTPPPQLAERYEAADLLAESHRDELAKRDAELVERAKTAEAQAAQLAKRDQEIEELKRKVSEQEAELAKQAAELERLRAKASPQEAAPPLALPADVDKKCCSVS